MSTTVDSRVLEMRFDNGQFEKGVSTSMSTLDKLKEKLNLSGASKGLENVNAAAGKFKMDGISSALDAVQAKFSAMQVIGMTALSNITNSAINAGKRMISAFTIEPIRTGFNEFELKMGSVQTIMASTGASLEEVNRYLNELNEYSDKTIYSFSDMTQNIGKFTNAGVKLEDAVMAIKGISNEAALSGANANEASRAMYNFAQALSAGYVKLIDWKSIENANMATVSFKEQLLEAGVAAGTLAKNADGMYQVLTENNLGSTMDSAISATSNFNESLAYQWLTTDVLVDTLKDYADETTEIGKKAFASAQDVKTFSMMMDTLKEAAQSGWAQTWELIVGNFEEGKTLWTSLSKIFGDLIENSAKARNEFLGGALNSNWEKIVDQIQAAGIPIDDFQNKVKETAKAHGIAIDEMIEKQGSLAAVMESGAVSGDIIKEVIRGLTETVAESSSTTEKSTKDLDKLAEVAAKVVRGDFGNTMEERTKALAEAGYDYAEVQEIINKAWEEGGHQWGTFEEIQEACRKAIGENAESLADLSDEELKNQGYTEEQIKALRELAKQADETGTPLNELIENLGKPSGRQLLFDSITTSIKSVIKVFDILKQSWKDVFGKATSDQLYSIIEAVHSFAESLSSGIADNASKLSSIFKGFFSILDMGKKVLSTVAGFFMDILGSSGVKSLGEFLLNTAASIGDFFTSLNKKFQVDGLAGIFDTLSTAFSNFLELITGKLGNVGDTVSGWISNLLKNFRGLAEGFDGVVEAFSIAGGLISKVATGIWSALKEVFGWIGDHISIGKIFNSVVNGGSFALMAIQVSTLLQQLKKGVKSFLNVFGGNGKDKSGGIKEKIAEILDSVHKSLESFTTGIKTASLIGIAVAVGILVNALEDLSELRAEDIGVGLTAIASMMAMLSASLRSVTKILGGKGSKTKGLLKTGASLILIAKAVEILSNAMTKISDMSWEEMGRGITGIASALLSLSAVVRIINGNKISLSTSVAMIALAQSCKMLGDAMIPLSGMSWEEIGHGLTAMGGALGELVAAVSILSKTGGFGSMLGSTGILIVVQSLEQMAEGLKSFADMSWEEIGHGLAGMGGALGELSVALSILSKAGGFRSIFSSAGILIAVQSLKKLSDGLKSFSDMPWEEIGRGLTAMGGALGELVAALSILNGTGSFGSVLGSAGILIAVQSLKQLAEGLKSFSGISWEEIGRGLTAMGGALGEVGVAIGALGNLAGFSSIFGSSAIWITVQGLGDLASALTGIAQLSWEEIGRGLSAMGGALLEVGGISGILGEFTSIAGLFGGGAIALASANLGDLADALGKFASMNWSEIGRGLSAMGAAMGETALGSIINTFSGIGSKAISTVAEPLGELADSVKKWENVSVPEGLGKQLGSIADAIKKFSFKDSVASGLSNVAAPLGVLANSVKNWANVSIPSSLVGEDGSLASLAEGIKNFNFTWLAGSSINELALPLGSLADSISKWSSVSVPSELGGEDGALASLAKGIEKFRFKGDCVTTISSVAEPLGTLAGSVKKWSNVQFPEDLPEKMASLSEAVSAMAATLSEHQTELESFGSSLGEGLFTSLSEAVDNVTGTMDALVSGVSSYEGDFTDGGETLGSAFVSALEKAMEDASSTADTKVGGALDETSKYQDAFGSSGTSLGLAFVTSLGSALSGASSAAASRVSAAAAAISGYWQSFYNAGANLGSGLVSGIQARTTDVYNAGFALGQAAVNGEKAGQQSKSPSKLTIKAGKWLGEGLVIGMQDMSSKVYTAGKGIGQIATESLSAAIKQISDFASPIVDIAPRIRPVLDLTNVENGVGTMRGMLDFSPALAIGTNAGAISFMMSQRNQNGPNDDLISAISHLEKSLGNRGGDTYTINGITYDDGSNITAAVRSLIRAVRVERRV